MLTIQISAFAETNKKNDEVVLHYKMAGDDSFKFYISDSDAEKGHLIQEGVLALSEGDINLKAEKTYYFHIEVTEIYGGWGGFAGCFILGGDKLATNVNDFKVSKTGFGENYLTPTIVNYLYKDIPISAQWIWTNNGSDLYCTRYFSAAIIPNSDIPDTISNLKTSGGDSKVDLTWNAVTDATSYTVKRSTTAGGPYTTIATGITGTTYTDTGVTNGTTYYYVVTAIVNGSEGWNSNEASATPQASTDPNQPTGNKAFLVISMVTGERKEYEMTTDKINDFIAWYNSKAASGPTYVIEKDYNKASFKSRKDYIAYDQISNFEVNEYNK
jgi:hypothetical protein